MKNELNIEERKQKDGSTIWSFTGDKTPIRAVLCLLTQGDAFAINEKGTELTVQSRQLCKEDLFCIIDMLDIYPFYLT
jgi:hypothetical protein